MLNPPFTSCVPQVLLATISLHQTRALPGILDPMPAVPVETPQLEIAMKTSQSEESLPQALPLASPERSSVDEEHFNVCISYKKVNYSCPILDGSFIP